MSKMQTNSDAIQSSCPVGPVFQALFIGFILIALFFWFKQRKSYRSDIILTGLSNSGKTYLFSQLLFSIERDTFTSMEQNEGVYQSDNGTIRIVDIPGDEGIRNTFWEKNKNAAKGLVFLIDSVTFQKDLADVADYLYTLLSDGSTSSTPILILCNKQDEAMAKGKSAIKSALEKEINIIRETRTSQLINTNNEFQAVYLGKKGKDFSFNQLSQPIEILECSAKEKSFEEFENWIKRLI